MKIKTIVTGATGMVGEGVLHVALNHPDVEQVLVLGRRTCGVRHPKMKEIVHSNLFDLSSVESELKGYNACYFCLGTSSIGMNEQDYTKITYELTMNTASTLSKLNPEMTFCYISGEGTDSTEQGKQMWARVKGKTENDLMKLPFKSVYNFRPGFIKPIKGMRNTLSFAKPLGVLYPVLKTLFPSHVCRLTDIGISMISVTQNGFSKKIVNNNDLELIARSNT